MLLTHAQAAASVMLMYFYSPASGVQAMFAGMPSFRAVMQFLELLTLSCLLVCSAHRLLNDMHRAVSRCALLVFVHVTPAF